MANIAIIVGSPSSPSRTAHVASYVAGLLAGDAHGHTVDSLFVRDLPAAELIRAQADAPEIARAVGIVERADALVVATPIYKASFSGVLKTFLDLLPQFAFRGKSVLPLATAGATVHVLAVDYALRPVLMALGAAYVAPAYVVHEQQVVPAPGGYRLADDAARKLSELTARFARIVALGRLE